MLKNVSQGDSEKHEKTFGPPETNPVFDRFVHLPNRCGDNFLIFDRQPVQFRHSLNQPALPQHRLHRLVHQKIRQRLRGLVQRGDGRL